MDITAGWYGKLPALGDFATRRLPPAFVEPWDRWLAEGLGQWRSADDNWLGAYLGGPVWRYVAGAGSLGPSALKGACWAGVLMPSVDRVGRYFPFTIAARLGADAASQAAACVQWMNQASELAACALQEDWTAEQVDSGLAQLADATVTAAAVDSGADELTRLVAASIGAAGHVLWWRPLDDGSVELQRSQGLPAGTAFTRLLSGLPLATEPT